MTHNKAATQTVSSPQAANKASTVLLGVVDDVTYTCLPCSGNVGSMGLNNNKKPLTYRLGKGLKVTETPLTYRTEAP